MQHYDVIVIGSGSGIVRFSSLTGFMGYASMAEINWVFVLPAAVA